VNGLAVADCAIFVKGALRYLGQEDFPIRFEALALFLERCPGAVSMLSRMQPGIGAA
jgi:hypothetical protein